MSGCKNQWGLSWWKKILEPQAIPFKEPNMDLLRLNSLELQYQGSSLKGTSGVQEVTEVSGIKARAGGQLSPRQKGGQRPLSLF